jgi:hypothetical protein
VNLRHAGRETEGAVGAVLIAMDARSRTNLLSVMASSESREFCRFDEKTVDKFT